MDKTFGENNETCGTTALGKDLRIKINEKNNIFSFRNNLLCDRVRRADASDNTTDSFFYFCDCFIGRIFFVAEK